MSERRFVYKIEVDTSTLAAAEAEIQRRLGGAMAQIKAEPPIKRIDPRTVAGGGVNVAAIQQQEQALLASRAEMEKRITADAIAEAKVRESVAKAEATERIEAARMTRIRTAEEERRATYASIPTPTVNPVAGTVSPVFRPETNPGIEAARAARIEAEQEERRTVASARAAAAESGRLASEAANKKIEAARAARLAAVEEERKVTAAYRAEAKSRDPIAQAAANEKINAARTARIHAQEEERRITATVRAEAKEREQVVNAEANERIEAARMVRIRAQEEERRAVLNARPAPKTGGGMMAGLGRELSGVAMGALSVYGAVQAGQALYDAGKQGAANQQLAASFDALTKSVGLTGASLTQKLGNALAGTMPDMKLMAETNRLLLTAQNEGITVTEKQIETLGRFARLRATQLTANGKPLGADEAYSRLITGVTRREMELLDELSISSKGLASQLGVDVKDVNSSVESLLTAITKVAEMELGSIGDPLQSDAEKIQKAETDITNAMNRLRASAVKPIVFSVEFVADRVNKTAGLMELASTVWEGAFDDESASIAAVLGDAQKRMTQMQNAALGTNVTDAQVEEYQKARESAERYAAALDTVKRAEAERKSQIYAPVGSGKIFADGIDSIDAGNSALRELDATITATAEAYARLAKMEQSGIVDPAALAPAEAAWYRIANGIADGNIPLSEANVLLAQMLGMLDQIAPIIGPTMAGAARGVTTWADGAMQNWAANSRANQVMAGNVAPGDLSESERGYRLSVGDRDEKIAIYEDLTAKARAAGDMDKFFPLLATLNGLLSQKQADEQSAIDKTRERFASENEKLADAQFQLAFSLEDTTGQLALYRAQLDGLVVGSAEELNLRRQIGGLERQLANEQQSAAKRVEAEWKAAAEKTAQEFENALKKVPGLFSPSPVTEEDMTLSKYGLYQPKADEWLRQAEDELRNGKDYAHIDRGDIERRLAEATGFAAEKLQALPGDILADLLRGSFADHTLFADPLTGAKRNLDIIDPTAVQADYAKQMQSAQGEKNLMSLLTGQAGQFGFGAGTPDNLNAFLDQLTGDNGMAAKVSAGIAEATSPVSDFGATALRQFNESGSLAQFYQIGKVSAGETFRGWSENIGGAPFAVAMAESIKQSIIDEFSAIFNGNR